MRHPSLNVSLWALCFLLADHDSAMAQMPGPTEAIVQQAYLKASNTDDFDRFGQAVAISGETLVVGAKSEGSSAKGVNGNENDLNSTWAGAAYAFGLNLPFTTLGWDTTGTNGYPKLSGTGLLQKNTLGSMDLEDAAPTSQALLLLSPSKGAFEAFVQILIQDAMAKRGVALSNALQLKDQ